MELKDLTNKELPELDIFINDGLIAKCTRLVIRDYSILHIFIKDTVAFSILIDYIKDLKCYDGNVLIYQFKKEND